MAAKKKLAAHRPEKKLADKIIKLVNDLKNVSICEASKARTHKNLLAVLKNKWAAHLKKKRDAQKKKEVEEWNKVHNHAEFKRWTESVAGSVGKGCWPTIEQLKFVAERCIQA